MKSADASKGLESVGFTKPRFGCSYAVVATGLTSGGREKRLLLVGCQNIGEAMAQAAKIREGAYALKGQRYVVVVWSAGGAMQRWEV